MGRNSYYPQKYKRKDGVIEFHYVWSNELKKAKHTAKNGERLTFKNVYEEPIVEAPGITTMTKSRVAAYKKKRNLDHFKKEIFPQFKSDSLERKHFAKKHGMKS